MRQNSEDPADKSPNNRARMLECFHITRQTRRELVKDKKNSVEFIFEKYPLILNMPSAISKLLNYYQFDLIFLFHHRFKTNL